LMFTHTACFGGSSCSNFDNSLVLSLRVTGIDARPPVVWRARSVRMAMAAPRR
jgi:hypothetical protein